LHDPAAIRPRPRLRILQLAALGLALAAGSAAASPPGEAAAARVVEFRIPRLPLDQALLEYSRQSGLALAATGSLRRSATARAVHGAIPAGEALRQLLEGSGYRHAIEADGLVRVFRSPRRRATAAPPAAQPAPQEPDASPVDLSRIVVTAQRRDQLQVDVPITVSVLQGEDMDALGLASASQGLQLLPGVTTVDGGTALTQVQIRGVSSSLGGNDNAYYLDEVPFTGVTVPWHPDTRAFDLERIEVLKGPQGALFGEGSMGGTVRILTRAPELDRFAARLETGAERTADGTGGSQLRAMANLPLAQDRLALRLVGTRESLPAWISDGRLDGSGAVNRQRIDTRRARLRWQSDRWTTDLSHARSRHDSPRGGYAADDAQATGSGMDTRSHWRSTSATATTAIGDTRLVLLASRAALHQHADGLFAPDALAELDIAIDVRTQEVRWSSSGTGAVDWVLGYSRRQALRQDRTDVQGLAARSRQHNHANALFADATITDATGRWSGSGGFRYFHDRMAAHTTTEGREAALSSTFARFNPRLVVSRHLSAQRKLHASASTGFRSGQLQPATSVVLTDGGDLRLPQRIDGDGIVSYELGYTHATGNGRGLLQAALFHSQWSDLPVRVPLDGIHNGLVNSRGARIDGLELGLTLLAGPGTKLQLGGTRVHARYVDDVPGTPLVAGSPVYNVPRTSLFAAAIHRRPLGDGLQGLASLHASHHSPRLTGLVEGHEGDAITRVAARLGVASPAGWELSLYGENLLDDRGAVDARDLGGQATRLRPRTLGIELHLAY